MLTTFTGMPHYGATLLRVYEHRADRQRYALFAVWASLAIWGTFVWGVYDPLVGSLMLTVYLTWSPWHYTGQNYGLAVMFLRRAGVDFDAGTKRLLYASFLLSYALAFLTLHSDPSAPAYGPEVVGWTYRFIPIRLPAPLYTSLFQGFLLLYLASIAMAGWRLRGAGRRLAAPAMLVGTQAVWFSIPSITIWLTGYALPARDVAFLFVWIAVGHAVQYLWITTYYAVGAKGGVTRARYLGKTLFAGAIVWTVPALIFSPGLLGDTTYLLGLFILVASAVNLQHFVLDGAIWKLRDGPVARILLARAKPEPANAIDPGDGWRIGRPAFLIVGAVSVFIAIAGTGLHNVAWRRAVAAGDSLRAERIEDWLGWMGRDEPAYWNRRARASLAAGDGGAAIALFQESLSLHPNPDAWIGIGDVRMARGDESGALDAYRRSLEIVPTGTAWSAIGQIEGQRSHDALAAEAYQRAIEIAPTDAKVLQRYGRFWLARGDREKALPALERAASADPNLPSIRRDLAKARR